MDEQVKVERRGSVMVVTLNRPTKLNALSTIVLETIQSVSETVSTDPQVRVVAILAEGKAFSAGADLNDVSNKSHEEILKFELLAQRAMLSLEQVAMPVIAGARGVALAGGTELLLACDVVVASENLQIGDGHVRYGLIPGAGGSQRLPRAIGPRRALELLFTGKSIGAVEAQQIGLVNEVVRDNQLEKRVLELADEFATHSRAALARMKELVYLAGSSGLAEGLERETALSVEHLRSPDAVRGLEAFSEKRGPPIFD